ncbi:hypothetical protein A4D02_13180 [Niastella koreensis]|uniref:Uncharacterized protein n=2 Tax=Niastella koreensis TaxID=354356 RepID=G8TMC3_NIAKG|nr:hypothetical protein [Niastella koreensis]AEW00905.1 hypothetical protein Niako_4649 [Niastella koreensis GR20-10]OQP42515.1 hypothetical protein A4D02_13180 [Niastella koreensis]
MNSLPVFAKFLPLKKVLQSVLLSGIILLLLSALMFFAGAKFLPGVTQQYMSSVFRSAGKTDWMFYAHPFIVSIALKWFWERYKTILKGSLFLKAVEMSLVYGIVALIPVLWLTFSAIDVSFSMVITWLFYGLVQAFAAGIIFAKLNP